MALLQREIERYCRRHNLLRPGGVVVAVSGGPDSLCLLHVLRQLAPAHGLVLHVAHLNHGLRPDSESDAAFVADVARRWDLPTTTARYDIAVLARERHSGVEATARAVRYRFLLDTARQVGAGTIAVGHTADDQAETVLLRLLRGAGPSGLAAMRPRRLLDDGAPNGPLLIRPLLETERAAVESYCRKHGLEPRHDPSNALPIYRRNSVRGYIIPLLKTYNARIIPTLGRTARICAEEDELLQMQADALWNGLAQVRPGEVGFERAAFAVLHRALQRRLLRKAAATLITEAEIESKHIDLALEAVQAGRRRLQWPGGLWLSLDRHELRLSRPVERGQEGA